MPLAAKDPPDQQQSKLAWSTTVCISAVQISLEQADKAENLKSAQDGQAINGDALCHWTHSSAASLLLRTYPAPAHAADVHLDGLGTAGMLPQAI